MTMLSDIIRTQSSPYQLESILSFDVIDRKENINVEELDVLRKKWKERVQTKFKNLILNNTT